MSEPDVERMFSECRDGIEEAWRAVRAAGAADAVVFVTLHDDLYDVVAMTRAEFYADWPAIPAPMARRAREVAIEGAHKHGVAGLLPADDGDYVWLVFWTRGSPHESALPMVVALATTMQKGGAA